MSAIPWILLGLGAYGIHRSHDLERKQKASTTWPRVPGRLVMVRPRELSGNFDDDLLIPLVQYRYRVDGELYHSCEIDFAGDNALAPEAFDRKMAGLERGREVTVYYDPSDPRRSVIRPGECNLEERNGDLARGWLMVVAGLVVLGVELSSGLSFFAALRGWLP